MDHTGQMFEGKVAEPILDLIGGEIEAYDSLPAEEMGERRARRRAPPVGMWGDLMYAEVRMRKCSRNTPTSFMPAPPGHGMDAAERRSGRVSRHAWRSGPFTDAMMEKLATQSRIHDSAVAIARSTRKDAGRIACC